MNYYPRIFPNAKYNASSHTWTFPSGAKVIFGSLHRPTDRLQYQGLAFDTVIFDELTHFLFEEYIYLFSRCRPNGPGTQCYVRATCNPGGVGHGWVKERFITPAPPMTPIEENIEWVDPQGNKHSSIQHRIFVPSTVFDNEALLKNDPGYVQRLAAMPEAERNALLYGDWNSFSGQAFREWVDDPKHYQDQMWTHVIEPFRIPKDWIIWCGLDWGYARPYSVGYYAIKPNKGRLGYNPMYQIAEIYGTDGTPNVGSKEEPSQVAQHMHELEEQDPNLKGRKIYRVGDPAIWGKQYGASIGELFERERIYFDKGNNERISGKMQMHYRLAFNEEGYPLLQFFNTCRHAIRTIPSLVYDEKNVEDIDTDGEDHAYDQTRYVLMKNPVTAPPKRVDPPKPYDPLSKDEVIIDKYEFFRRF